MHCEEKKTGVFFGVAIWYQKNIPSGKEIAPRHDKEKGRAPHAPSLAFDGNFALFRFFGRLLRNFNFEHAIGERRVHGILV